MKIAQWNANGWQSRKEEIKLFLYQYFIDILLISETNLKIKIALACQNSNYTTSITVVAQRTEVLGCLKKEQSKTMNC